MNNFLTGVLWGYEDDNGEWKWISESPLLQKPKDCLRCITYFKYLEDQIVKEPAHRKDLRFRTGNFIPNEGQDFRRFYNDLIMFVKPFLYQVPPVWVKYMGKQNFLEPTRHEINIFTKH